MKADPWLMMSSHRGAPFSLLTRRTAQTTGNTSATSSMPRIIASLVVLFISCPLVQRVEISKFSKDEFSSATGIEIRAMNLPNILHK